MISVTKYKVLTVFDTCLAKSNYHITKRIRKNLLLGSGQLSIFAGIMGYTYF